MASNKKNNPVINLALAAENKRKRMEGDNSPTVNEVIDVLSDCLENTEFKIQSIKVMKHSKEAAGEVAKFIQTQKSPILSGMIGGLITALLAYGLQEAMKENS